MTWVLLSLLGAFGQALGWAIKKKALENQGTNNTLGFVYFFVSGVLLLSVFVCMNGLNFPAITKAFVVAIAIIAGFNVIASWTAYRAIDKAPLSLLMPFSPLSVLGMVPIEYFARGVLPSIEQFLGILILVCGAILFSLRQIPDRRAIKAVSYFFVSLVCLAISGPYMVVAVREVQSPLFAASMTSFTICLGFIPLVLASGEGKVIRRQKQAGRFWTLFIPMILSGVVVALFDHLPINTAMMLANANEVISLKRTMPFFALILGVMMFHEKVTKQHVLGTFLMVAGSILIVWYK